MTYKLNLTKTAIKDLERHKKSGNQPLLKKLQKLLVELMENPKVGTGQPEILKHQFAGLYSRRINKQHRLIYSIDEDMGIVSILSFWSHYDRD